MTAITASDPRKASVVAAMKAKLGADTRITTVNYDKATETFSGHAPFISKNVSVLASEIANLPVVEKVKPVARFTPAEIPAAIDQFLRENAVEKASKRKIWTSWTTDKTHVAKWDMAHYGVKAGETYVEKGYDFTSDYHLLDSCGTHVTTLAQYLGLTKPQTHKIVAKMIENGVLFGMKLTWGWAVLPQDATLRATLTNTILTNPRLG